MPAIAPHLAGGAAAASEAIVRLAELQGALAPSVAAMLGVLAKPVSGLARARCGRRTGGASRARATGRVVAPAGGLGPVGRSDDFVPMEPALTARGT